MATPAATLQIWVNANTSQATASLAKTQAQLKGVAATAATTSKAMGTRIATGAKYGAVAVAGLAAVSVKAAVEFESSFAEVRKTVDTSEKGFKRLEDQLRSLAQEIPVSVDELNALAGQAGALGIKSKDLVKFTKTAAELGITTDLSSSDAANALARLANVMGTSSKDFRRLGSTFVELGNKGASTEAEIAAMALRISGAGRQVGLTEDEVLSFGSALASVGIDAEAGGSAISRAFITMAKAVDAGGADLEEFADVAGMTGGKFATTFEDDAAGAMVAFLQGLENVKKSGGSVFTTLDGLELGEIRVRDALLRASGASDLFSDTLKVGSAEWERNSALTEEANKRYATTAAKWQVMKNKANDLFISIGQDLLPELNDMMDILSDPKLTLDEKVKKLGDKLGDMIAEWGPKAAEAGGKVGLQIVSGLGRAFLDANLWGKLFLGGLFIRAVGGKGALLAVGKKLAVWIAAPMMTTIAAEVAAGAAAGSFAAKWKGVGAIAGRFMGAGILLSAPLWIKPLGDMLNEHLGGLFGDKDRLDLTGDSPIFTPEGGTGMTLEDLEAPDWEKTLGLKDFEKIRKQISGGHRDLWGDITRQTGRGSDDTEDRTRTNHQRVRDGFEDTRRKLDDVTRKQAQDVGGNVGRMVDAVGEGLKTLGSNTNKALQAFGAKKVGFSIDSVGDSISGALKRQRGGMIPGLGNTDSVPTMLTPGEGVITKTAVGKWGGPAFIDFINHAQHLAGGGVVTGDTDYLPALGQALMSMSASTGRSISVQSGGRSMAEQQALYARYLAGGNLAAVPNANAPHVRGIAADITPGREAFGSVAGKFGLGFPVSSESWHVELLNAAAAGKMGITAQKVARLLLKGPDGPLKSMGQGALDKARSAANSFIASQMPTVSAGFGGISTKGLGSGPAANRELGRKMMLTMFGADQWSYLDHLWGTDEGRWDENLANLAGSGAYGIAQALPSSKYPLAGQPSAPPGIEKARAQIGWGLDYIDERYGNPAAADDFRHRIGWYAKGGLVEKFAAQIPQFHDGGMFRAKRPGGEGLAMLRDREIVSTQHDIGHLRKRLRDDGLDNKDRQRIELQIELLKTIVAQNAEAQRERKAIRRQGDQTKRLNRQEVARFLSEELGAGLGQMGSRRALGTAGSGSVGRY